MRRDIRPEWLLRLAKELGGEVAGQGQPRNTNLRRAVSTAYYAVFHGISLATARSALPNAQSDEIFGVARHVSHTSIRQVAAYVTGDRPPKHLDTIVFRLRTHVDLSAVAATFIELQEQREEADYNHLADFSRPAVLTLTTRAERAIQSIDQHMTTDEFRAFFGLIALRTSIGRS